MTENNGIKFEALRWVGHVVSIITLPVLGWALHTLIDVQTDVAVIGLRQQLNAERMERISSYVQIMHTDVADLQRSVAVIKNKINLQ